MIFLLRLCLVLIYMYFLQIHQRLSSLILGGSGIMPLNLSLLSLILLSRTLLSSLLLCSLVLPLPQLGALATLPLLLQATLSTQLVLSSAERL
jgi:hypothetical protein